MAKETMTPLERWLAVLNRQKPDRVPMDYWGTDETSEKLMKHLGCNSREAALKKLNVDFSIWVEPRYAGPALPPNTDAFGIGYTDIDYGTGIYREATYHPLAQYSNVEEIERNYTWPHPDWWDYEVLHEQIKGFDEYPVRGGLSEPFLIYKDLRGQEQGMLDLVLNPDIVEYCLEKLFELAYHNSLRTFETIPGRVTYTDVAEDMGGQENLMYSPDCIRQFFFPGMKRMIELARQAGIFVFHHNDGSIMPILPELVELGIDVLNPIQWRAKGMDREVLKREFGDRLIFHGGMDNQYTLPFGSVAEVRQEVLDNLHILGEGGGYILAPCHNIQANTPVDNILAMYETCYEAGWT
jgi:uroporphyrinogen decarboxylase